MNTGSSLSCELCSQPGGTLLWEGADCRVVAVDDADSPGFCRVICKDHVREMTDLDDARQMRLMRVVFAVERVVRRLYAPDKINLASFGNQVPHVHWHIVPRWCDDRYFPESIWGKVQRESRVARAPVPLDILSAELLTALCLEG